MKISLIYIFNLKDKFLQELIMFVKQHKNFELIILDDTGEAVIKNKKNESSCIRYYTYPHVSRSFLYNRGLALATFDIVYIFQQKQNLDEIWAGMMINSKKYPILPWITDEFNKLNIEEKLFFPRDIALEKYFEVYNGNFFLNKKFFVENGLFFDEHANYLGILDLALRSKRYISIPGERKDAREKQKMSIFSSFSLGKELFWIFSKYQKSKYILLFYFLSYFIQSPLPSLTIILGIMDTFLKERMFRLIRSVTLQCNKMWNHLSRRFRLNKFVFFPIELAIEPTNVCNAHCPLCPTGSGQLKRAKGYMDFALFKKIIDESKFFVNRITLWNLGEPFLHPDIYSMIQYAKQYDIQIVASTNGYVFYTKKSIHRLMESEIDTLIVSSDGADSKTFLKYRKGVDYAKVICGLEYLRDEKKRLNTNSPYIELQIILMKQNLKQVDKVYQLSKKLETGFRAKYLSLEMVKHPDKGDFLPEDQKYRVYGVNNNKPILQRCMKNTPCVSWDGMVINWDGTVNPCIFDYYSDITLGNVNKNSLLNLWRGRKIQNLRKMILQDKKSIDICKRCPINEHYSELYYR